MEKDFYAEIRRELVDRATWEQKMATWYRMRYEGIKRSAKPYKNAPDMHYPLVDTMIEKLKPFYIAQIYGQERLAAFTSNTVQGQELTSAAEKLFDYTLKEQSNFERISYTSIDHMLMYSRGPIKTYWDTANNRLKFVPIRPIHLVVPTWTEDSSEADWLVHIIHMSVDQYEANQNFNQDPGLISRIRGNGGEGRSSGDTSQLQDKLRREGITQSQYSNQIIVWECYSRNADGSILVETISPLVGPDEPLRDPMPTQLDNGQFPFADLRYEIADPDYYSPRGIAEILSQNEQDLNKLWNHKLQFLDFFGAPNYQNNGSTVVNPGNFKNEPGRILPAGLTPVGPTSAPMDFQQEMQLQRALAEDRVQVPDLSAGEHLVGNRGSKGGVTATQINALVSQSSGGNDMRAKIFRLQLAVVYQQAWSLICKFKSQDVLQLQDYSTVPPQAVHDQYSIQPSGSPAAASKEQRVAKAMAYYQVFSQSPFINQGELTKWTIEQDDVELVQRLYIDPQQSQKNQAQLQASEIGLMKDGFPPQVNPSDDDKTHLSTLGQYAEYLVNKGQDSQVTPELAGLMLSHMQGHEQQIYKKGDKQGFMLIRKLVPLANLLGQRAMQGNALPQAPDGSKLSGGADQAQAQLGAGQQQGQQNQDRPSAVANALAALIKSGAQIRVEDVNAALVKMGLPPMAVGFQSPEPAQPAAAPAQ